MTETLVIAGAGQAAGQTAASLRQKDFAGHIVIVGDEPFVPYQRPPLSKKFLAGELETKRLFIKPESFYPSHEVELRVNTRIESIDRQQQQVLLNDGQKIDYSKLLLATGSRVRQLPVPGADLAGIYYLRNILDVQSIQQNFAAGKKLVIVGAGYIGLEVAAVAVQRGLDVTVLETETRVMNRVVAPEISEFYKQVHEAAGVKLEFGQMVQAFDGDGHVSEVICADGSRYAADFCIVGIGILPNEELAAEAGLSCDNGIIVDENCQTSDANILAAGDCTRHPNKLIGTNLRLESVHNAIEQGKTAAATIMGVAKPYNQIPWFWSDQYDLKLQIVGLNNGYEQLILRGDPATREFAAFYMQGDKLLAVDAINSPREFMLAKKLIKLGARLDPKEVANQAMDFKALALAAIAATDQE
jgi:3-phenylpropionate/trans-cinnamate dioxygenase ferredoxin reductase subunit